LILCKSLKQLILIFTNIYLNYLGTFRWT